MVPPEIVPVLVIVPELVIEPEFVILPEEVTVPEFVTAALGALTVVPAGIEIVSPLSPSVTVPQFVVGVILLTLTSLILPIDIYTLLLLYLIHLLLLPMYH